MGSTPILGSKRNSLTGTLSFLLAVHQFPRVRNLMLTDRPNLVGGSSNNRCGLAGKRYELDLVGFVPRIYVDDNSNITGLKPLVGKRDRQNHSVMFPDHDWSHSNG